VCEGARKELLALLAPTQLRHHPAEDLTIHMYIGFALA
jgi:hypothetical protein